MLEQIFKNTYNNCHKVKPNPSPDITITQHLLHLEDLKAVQPNCYIFYLNHKERHIIMFFIMP